MIDIQAAGELELEWQWKPMVPTGWFIARAKGYPSVVGFTFWSAISRAVWKAVETDAMRLRKAS